MTVRHAIKGFETHMHDTAAQARLCTELGGPDAYFEAMDAQAQAEAERASELAVERYFEDGGLRGWMETQAFEDYERAQGRESFTQAWHRQSPWSCPCPDHDNQDEIDENQAERELALMQD